MTNVPTGAQHPAKAPVGYRIPKHLPVVGLGLRAVHAARAFTVPVQAQVH